MIYQHILKYRIVLMLILLFAAIALSYVIFGSTFTKNNQYKFVTLTNGDIETTISSSGTLSPVTQVEVGTQVSGTISKIFVDFNDKVRKGQIIAIVDTSVLMLAVTDAQSGFLKAEAQLEEAQINYRRSNELFLKNLQSESDFQTVKTNLKTTQASMISAQSTLKRAQHNLRYAIIRSPIDGTVTARNIEVGQTVAASFATPTLFTIAQDLSKMEIKALVDESDIGQIKERQSARFTVQAYPNKKFEGIVKQVRVQPTTTSNVVNYTVVISAENKDNLLLPGMTATVDFVIAQKSNILVVPNSALRFQPTEKEIAEAQKLMQSDIPPSDSLSNTKPQHQGGVIPPPQTQFNDNAEWKRIWFLDIDDHLMFSPILVGISDGTNTEILDNHFSAGKQVIIGMESGTQGPKPSKLNSGGPPPPPMM
jgi:HlyD family secretion protein